MNTDKHGILRVGASVRSLGRVAVAIAVFYLADPAFARIEQVRATESDLVFELSDELSKDSACAIRAIAVHEQNQPDPEASVVWSGVLESNTIRIPRIVDERDLLYSRFELVQNGKSLGPGIHATDLSAISPPAAPLPTPDSPKGLQCIVDIDDAIALGVKHSAVNVSLARLYDETGRSPIRHDVDGESIAINPRTVAWLDETVGRMSAAGMRVNLILLNYLPDPKAPATPLIDPRTDRGTPQGIGGFHLDTPEAVRLYRGLIEFLAARYSQAGAPHGTVAGYIVGNEIQSHYDWYNLGDVELPTLVNNYSRALRVADLAVRQHHPEARVLISMDHNWTRQHRSESTRSVPGRELLDALNSQIQQHGDFPWGVAFHPYPENLGNPRTWDDSTALLDFNTPRITFKNLEVLTAYLRQPHFLYQGGPRRIILSEQGFHCLDSPEGEVLQAAAYAYAYERVRRVKGIESFIYHRHVDHAGEGGLHLGLRENRPGTTSAPGEARKIYDLFRVIDTPNHADATDFALDVIDLDSWNTLAPRAVSP